MLSSRYCLPLPPLPLPSLPLSPSLPLPLTLSPSISLPLPPYLLLSLTSQSISPGETQAERQQACAAHQQGMGSTSCVLPQALRYGERNVAHLV